MYLRTPKRYQVGHKRRHFFSMRWLWLWILTPLVAIGGWLIYQNKESFGPPVREFIAHTVDNARGGIATITAPTALPTGDPADHIIRGDNAWTQGAVEQALTEYKAALDGAPNNEQIHYRYTYGLLMEEDNTDALQAAEDTVTADPFNSDAWAIRALALDHDKQYAAAIASGLQALSINPKNAKALAFISETYLDAGQPANAEEKANEAIQADPNSPEAHFALGAFNYNSSYIFQTALDEFKTANDLQPNLPLIMVNLAWTNFQLQDYDSAQAQFQQVVETNPNNLDALYGLGQLNYQIYGDPSKAEDYLTRCTQVDAKNIPCLSYLALVQIGNGHPQDAAVSYQHIIDAGTTDPVDYLHAGRTYANLNDCKSAIPLLRQGYNLEQKESQPNSDRLAAFQQFMSQCNAPFSAILPSSTEDGPLLIPLNNGG